MKKFWVIALSITTGLFLFASISLYFGNQEETAKRVEAEKKLASLFQVNEDLKSQLDAANKAKIEMGQQLDDTKKQLAVLTSQLEEERKAEQQLTDQLAEIQSQMQDAVKLKTDLEARLGTTQAVADQAQAFLQERDRLAQELEQLRKQAAQGNSRRASAASEAPASAPESPSAPKLEGKVLVVNEEFKFVVVDLGQKSGLPLGADLTVYRKDKPIARAKVRKLYDELASATLVDEAAKVKANDVVRTF